MTPGDGLREYQLRLGERLRQASEQQLSGMRLAFEAAGRRWLVPLDAVHGVVALPLVTPVPGAPAWLWGAGAVRGVVYACVDWGGFLGASPTRREGCRLLLSHPRDRAHVALVIDTAPSMRSLDTMLPDVPADGDLPDWVTGVRRDAAGLVWHLLDLPRLWRDPTLLQALA